MPSVVSNGTGYVPLHMHSKKQLKPTTSLEAEYARLEALERSGIWIGGGKIPYTFLTSHAIGGLQNPVARAERGVDLYIPLASHEIAARKEAEGLRPLEVLKRSSKYRHYIPFHKHAKKAGLIKPKQNRQ